MNIPRIKSRQKVFPGRSIFVGPLAPLLCHSSSAAWIRSLRILLTGTWSGSCGRRQPGLKLRIGFQSLGQHIHNGRTSAGRFRPEVICCICTDGRCENEHLSIFSYKWSCEVLTEAPTTGAPTLFSADLGSTICLTSEPLAPNLLEIPLVPSVASTQTKPTHQQTHDIPRLDDFIPPPPPGAQHCAATLSEINGLTLGD